MEYRSIFLNALEAAPLPYIPVITFCHQTPHTQQKKRVLHYWGFLLLGFELGLLHTLMFPGFPQQGDSGRCPLRVSWCILVSVGVLW